MTIKNDQTYIDKVLKGDTNAYAFLVEKYKVMVYSLAVKMLNNKEEAEEVSQDTFVKAYKNLAKFEGKSKFSTWLYKITYRNCLDAIKKNSVRYTITDINEITFNQIQATETILDGIERDERSKIINDCLQKLPEEERTILWLFYYQELSLKEIIEVTELSEANVKVKLHRARKHLLTIVKKNVEPEIINHYGRK
ncbi:sigma-70 family RNA polymerase sigma factor [Tenacibaculum sp. IB213877]|uniref:RNA polymerase sigma factor n=1 Tax=Tenacibaculum sp. IB213877 TaxID=3097351 RepID=UPI002A59D571|nr:sigma-70 family RNA polymerase sigma factor [Tenacibaculum sp. IB213877]MDY0779773.1 sigma-70 family RNA polymerase sigma factor [Tenacibaculum sp. IB213877]